MIKTLLRRFSHKTAGVIEGGKRVLIFTDANRKMPYRETQPAPDASENEPVYWHFDPNQKRTLKRIARSGYPVHAHDGDAREQYPLPVAIALADQPYPPGCGQAGDPQARQCRKQLKAEVIHLRPAKYKTLRPNAVLAKFPAQPVRTPGNYALFMICAALLLLRVKRLSAWNDA